MVSCRSRPPHQKETAEHGEEGLGIFTGPLACGAVGSEVSHLKQIIPELIQSLSLAPVLLLLWAKIFQD
jgi:hypothetical protein